jgi:hypothetical protein
LPGTGIWEMATVMHLATQTLASSCVLVSMTAPLLL